MGTTTALPTVFSGLEVRLARHHGARAHGPNGAAYTEPSSGADGLAEFRAHRAHARSACRTVLQLRCRRRPASRADRLKSLPMIGDAARAFEDAHSHVTAISTHVPINERVPSAGTRAVPHSHGPRAISCAGSCPSFYDIPPSSFRDRRHRPGRRWHRDVAQQVRSRHDTTIGDFSTRPGPPASCPRSRRSATGSGTSSTGIGTRTIHFGLRVQTTEPLARLLSLAQLGGHRHRARNRDRLPQRRSSCQATSSSPSSWSPTRTSWGAG